VIICGAAGGIASKLLVLGARDAERCAPKCEPLLLLPVVQFPEDYASASAGIDAALSILADKQTRVDGIVWYDIERDSSATDLERLQRAASRRGAPIMALRPHQSFERAAREHARVAAGQLQLEGLELYRELRQMIESRSNSDPDGVLLSLS
jgi:hypothetical protein